MRIKKTEIKVYPFDELSDDAKEKAVEGLWDINVDYEWWDGVFEDAEQVKLKLTEFDIDRGSYCRGDFIEYAKDTADAIIFHHGENCETRQSAEEYIVDCAILRQDYPENNIDGFDVNEFERDSSQEDLDGEFLKSILEDYRIMLQKEYEYLTSEDVIIEMIKTNEYEFTEDGELA